MSDLQTHMYCIRFVISLQLEQPDYRLKTIARGLIILLVSRSICLHVYMFMTSVCLADWLLLSSPFE